VRPADELAARRVHPDALTYAAVGCGVAGGAALAYSGEATWLLGLVPLLAGARIALNALDGMVAQRRGLARPWGKVLNEVCDRLSDLKFFAGLLFVPGASVAMVGAALVAMLMASYVGVVAEAAGGKRQYGGVMGKADRMLWMSLASAATWTSGRYFPLRLLPAVILVGSLVTIVQRGRAAYADLQSAR
jgi:phosphatidylglycerophosphate synthase